MVHTIVARVRSLQATSLVQIISINSGSMQLVKVAYESCVCIPTQMKWLFPVTRRQGSCTSAPSSLGKSLRGSSQQL